MMDKKIEKKERILEAAYDLFIRQGKEDVSIQMITDAAGVAKGTFYLYFQDKEDLQEQVITKRTNRLFRTAVAKLEQAENREGGAFGLEGRVIFVVNFLIDYFTENPEVLRLVAKNLTLGLFNEKILKLFETEKIDVLESFLDTIEKTGVELENPKIVLFMIFELVSATSFSCILYGDPLEIKEYKPILFRGIRGILRENLL